MSYPQILEAKNRLKNSLGSANLQEHYTIILKVRNIACVTVIAIYCILFMKRKKLVNEMLSLKFEGCLMAYITKDGKWLAYRDATNEYDDSPKRPIICRDQRMQYTS